MALLHQHLKRKHSHTRSASDVESDNSENYRGMKRYLSEAMATDMRALNIGQSTSPGSHQSTPNPFSSPGHDETLLEIHRDPNSPLYGTPIRLTPQQQAKGVVQGLSNSDTTGGDGEGQISKLGFVSSPGSPFGPAPETPKQRAPSGNMGPPPDGAPTPRTWNHITTTATTNTTNTNTTTNTVNGTPGERGNVLHLSSMPPPSSIPAPPPPGAVSGRDRTISDTPPPDLLCTTPLLPLLFGKRDNGYAANSDKGKGDRNGRGREGERDGGVDDDGDGDISMQVDDAGYDGDNEAIPVQANLPPFTLHIDPVIAQRLPPPPTQHPLFSINPVPLIRPEALASLGGQQSARERAASTGAIIPYVPPEEVITRTRDRSHSSALGDDERIEDQVGDRADGGGGGGGGGGGMWGKGIDLRAQGSVSTVVDDRPVRRSLRLQHSRRGSDKMDL